MNNSSDQRALIANLISSNALSSIAIPLSEGQATAIVQTAIENGVVEQVLANAAISKSSDCYKSLSKFATSNTIKLALIDSAALNALNALKNASIPYVVLKGFALAHTAYNKPTDRQRADVDILIDQKDKEGAAKVLEHLGFVNPRGWSPTEIVQQYSMRKVLSHGIALDFDIHTQLSNDIAVAKQFTFEELYRNANAERLNGIPLNSKPFALIHALLHMLHHRQKGDLIKLIWFYDIHLLINNISDSERNLLLDLCANKHFSKVAAFALGLCGEYFNSNGLSDLQRDLNTHKQSTKYDYLMTINKPMGNVMQELSKRGLSFRSLKLLQEMLFPPVAELHVKYGSFNAVYAPYYYIKRIMGGLMYKLFKVKR
ncbi:nucleotidyltransferase family protein [Glaciecola siphonariae]|uniref:Nucleotidyltransferase family protein n=1 Tax=Glaciecola siphonariae TaxID=521012 RepID=A0ABV9LWD3_9ALTE